MRKASVVAEVAGTGAVPVRQRQRRGQIPAWASGPGLHGQPPQGLEARSITLPPGWPVTKRTAPNPITVNHTQCHLMEPGRNVPPPRD